MKLTFSFDDSDESTVSLCLLKQIFFCLSEKWVIERLAKCINIRIKHVVYFLCGKIRNKKCIDDQDQARRNEIFVIILYTCISHNLYV